MSSWHSRPNRSPSCRAIRETRYKTMQTAKLPPVTDAALGRLTPTGSGSVHRWLLLAGFPWRHEARLARRDLVYLLTAGHRWHLRPLLLVRAMGFVPMLFLPYGMVLGA